ncbi:MAG: hypothetical protein E6R08_00855 [Nevskiaceae bacterium]|nr:MAG: hypothetical protein E6R08_00855 [Nevskiaceae bacterium]
MGFALSHTAFPAITFAVFLVLFVMAIVHGIRKNARDERRADARNLQQHEQWKVDTALRGVTTDLARHKAGLDQYGFGDVAAIGQFLRLPSDLVPVVVSAPSAPVSTPVAAVVQPAPASAPAVEVLAEDEPLPVPEVAVLVPDRIISHMLASGVNVVIGFYAGELVAVRTIQVADPVEYDLPASEYSFGQVEVSGRSDEQLLNDAMTIAPGVFLQIVSDPAVEQALRNRAA